MRLVLIPLAVSTGGASANQVSHRAANQVPAKDVWHSNTCVNWSWAVICDYEVSRRASEHMTNDQLSFTFRMCRDQFILHVYLSRRFTRTVIISIKAKMQNKLAFKGQMLNVAGGGDFCVIPSGMGSSPQRESFRGKKAASERELRKLRGKWEQKPGVCFVPNQPCRLMAARKSLIPTLRRRVGVWWSHMITGSQNQERHAVFSQHGKVPCLLPPKNK